MNKKEAFEDKKAKILSYLRASGEEYGPSALSWAVFRISASNHMMAPLRSLISEGTVEWLPGGKYRAKQGR